MLELNGERRDNRFILVQALDRDRVIALHLDPTQWHGTDVGPCM
jgi:hypothetical protein